MRRQTGAVASGSALSDCINVLEGEASELDPQQVFLGWAVTPVRIASHRWWSTWAPKPATSSSSPPMGGGSRASSPIIFRRSRLIHPLVEPVPGGSLDGLRALINLNDDDYQLAIAWAVAAFFTDIPHPILFVQGEQGTAKSNLIRSLLSLIDPQPAADREAPGVQRDWAIFARASLGVHLRQRHRDPAVAVELPVQRLTGDAVLQRALHRMRTSSCSASDGSSR